MQFNFSQIRIQLPLAIAEKGPWSLFKQGRVFNNIQIFGELFMPSKSQGALLVWNGQNTFFQWIVQKITITIQKEG